MRAGLQTRLLLLALAGGLPALVIAVVLLWLSPASPQLRWSFASFLTLFWLGCAWALHRKLDYHLWTLSNIISALREGDFSFRLTRGRRGEAFGEVILEINALAESLRASRLEDAEATALLRKVLGEIEVAVFSFDSKRRLRLVNQAGEHLLGRPAEELMGRSADQLLLAECLDGLSARIIRLRFPGGSGRWELRRGVYRHLGRPHHLVMLSDLSRTLRAEEVEAWKRLIRVIGHELNNSLAPIKSLAESLEQLSTREPKADDWQNDLARGLRIIASRAESLNRFMGAYADLARLPVPTPGPLQVTGWIRRVANMETRLDIRMTEGPDLTIRADGDQLEQLLINLLRNAVDASLETGGSVIVSWEQADSWLEVRVCDEGPGLSETGNLFVPFFTTKSDGSGIGLVLSRQIAEAHGGTLDLSNRPGDAGCEALLRLPLH